MAIECATAHPESNVLFAANHRFPPTLLPRLIEIDKEYKNKHIVFVCDAAFAWALVAKGLDTIKIDKRGCYRHIRDKGDKIKVYLTEIFGRTIGAYDNSKKGDDIAIEMTASLNHGRDVLIFPSGLSRKDAPWKAGIAKAVQLSDINQTSIGFVYIPSRFSENTKVSFSPVVGSFLPNASQLSSIEIARILQSEHASRFNKA